MANARATVDIGKTMHESSITVHVYLSRTTRVRLFIGGFLLKFAGWVIGFNAVHVHVHK